MSEADSTMDEVDREVDIAATVGAINSVLYEIGYEYMFEDARKNGVTEEQIFETFWREYFHFHSK